VKSPDKHFTFEPSGIEHVDDVVPPMVREEPPNFDCVAETAAEPVKLKL
jgi:hypothetical protein